MLRPKQKTTKTMLLLPEATWSQLRYLSKATLLSYDEILHQLASAPQEPTMLVPVPKHNMRRVGLTVSASTRALCKRNAHEATLSRDAYISAIVYTEYTRYVAEEELNAKKIEELLAILKELKAAYGAQVFNTAIDEYINNC